MVAKVDCPNCGAAVPWTEASPWRPFCSERCRLIDLGDWAAEQHVIPGQLPLGDAQEPSAPPASGRGPGEGSTATRDRDPDD